jgi:hypothetical protein
VNRQNNADRISPQAAQAVGGGGEEAQAGEDRSGAENGTGRDELGARANDQPETLHANLMETNKIFGSGKIA